MINHSPNDKKKSLVGSSWRSICLGTLLIIPNTYWIVDSGGQGFPTTVSLYYNVIFCIFSLVGFNWFISKINYSWAMKQSELLTIYMMLAIASSLAGHDVMRVLIPMIPYPFWYATSENDWSGLFHRFIPDWIAIKDKEFLVDYYRGESSFYRWEIIEVWLTPILVWGGFLAVMVFLMICINSVVRKQWTENEKLSYPIIQLPLEMTYGGGLTGVLKLKTLWLGFLAAGTIDILNGLHHLFPYVPSLGGKLYDLKPFFSQRPWSAVGWTPIAPLTAGVLTLAMALHVKASVHRAAKGAGVASLRRPQAL